jgi:TRAP-type C4-dicarboxylate transport system permease small subunit
MKFVRFVDRALSRFVTAFLVVTFAIMLILAALQVLLRGVFHSGILWGDVAARHLVILVGFLGAFIATRENRHFRIDVLTRFLHPRARLWFNAFADLFAAVICSFLLRASLTFVEVGLQGDTPEFLGLSPRALAMIVPVGFGLIMTQFLIRMLEGAVAAVRGAPAEGKA